jgi:putative ABC transport system permease protein
MVSGLSEFTGRLKSLFRKRRMDREMAEELAFHQELLREKLLREGMSPLQAAKATRRTFGNTSRWHERLRELWQFRWLENLLRDVQFSIRLLAKSPGFTMIALLTLALGLGANTSVFSLINGLLLRPLAVPHSEELAVLGMDRGEPRVNYSFPYPFFRALESKHEIFQDVFAFRGMNMLVKGRSSNESTRGMMVSGEYFRALQTPPLMGRYLTPQDDRTGGSPEGLAVVISEHFWESWFGRSRNVLGSKLEIANTVFTVVGVMPKRFTGADPTQSPEFYVSLALEPIIDAPEDLVKAGFHAWWMTAMARLKPGITLDKANAALMPLSTPILHEVVPDANWIASAQKKHFHFVAEPGSSGFTYLRFFFRKPLVALFSMCGGILLLACLNLASMLMARGAARERELATRLAMGATRRRLIQQLMVESLLIAILGAAVGLGVAPVVSQSIANMLLSSDAPSGVRVDTSLDLRVFFFTVLIAVVVTMLIGLIPALQATSGNLNDHIKDGQHSSTGRRKQLLQPILMASEVGLALMLVVGAGLLATSLFKLFTSGAGFNPKGVVNIELTVDKQPLDGDALMRMYQQFGEGLSHQPGVTAVSFARMVPFTHFTWDEEHSRPGGAAHDLYMNAVAPKYFEAMSIPLYQGRDFRWSDTTPTGLKIALNQSAAKLFFPNQNPIGQHILRDGNKKTDFEIIGVVGDAKYEDLRSPAPPAAYVPITQGEDKKPSYYAVVHTNGQAAPLAAAARSLAAQLAPDIPAPVMTTMEGTVNDSLGTERVMALLSVFFAGCALLVTAIGLYGTLAYNATRRTSEIGIRMALGAKRLGVVALIFRHNAVIAGVGLVAGLIAAALGSRVLASFLYETSPRDPWVLVGSILSLGLIASAASLLPAIRAARIEPITAIRCE